MANLTIHVVPNAKIDSLAGEHASGLKVKLRAPAVEGRANAALVRYLARQLQILPRQISLLRGHKSREKVIRIDGLSEQEIRRRLTGGTSTEPATIL